jgi:hypothetical protein
MMELELNVLGKRYRMPRRDTSEAPASLLDSIGYAEFEGSSTFKRCEYHKGKWTDHRRRPFDPQPVAWYSMVGMQPCE